MSGYIISDDIITIKTFKKYKITSFDIPCYNLNKNIYIVTNKKISYTKYNNYNRSCIHDYDFANKIEIMAAMNDDAHVLEWLFISEYTFTIEYIDKIINYAFSYEKIKVLEWVLKKKFLKKINSNFSIGRFQFLNIESIKTIKCLILNKPIKKIIKFMNVKDFKKYVKTIFFKTKNNYFKGYNKN